MRAKFLLIVSFTPFSTAHLAQYLTFRIALLTYWFNLLLLGLVLLAAWTYANRATLVKEDTSREARRSITRRILVAQALYAGAASLCVFNTCASIACIVLLQLNYAVAPRIWPLFWL